MFNLFSTKQKQESLEKEQKGHEESVEKLLSCLHSNTRVLFAKDVETYKELIKNREVAVPLMLLILASKVDYILERLDSLDEDLASTVEVHKDGN